jgi:hypothetical protein
VCGVSLDTAVATQFGPRTHVIDDSHLQFGISFIPPEIELSAPLQWSILRIDARSAESSRRAASMRQRLLRFGSHAVE